jgi:hypothetical protein
MMLNMAGHSVKFTQPEGHIENLYEAIHLESQGPVDVSKLDF